MTPEQVRQAFLEALGQIVPEGEFERLQPDRPLREQLDIDSYDFLQLVIALHERLGVDVPEADYQRLATLHGALEYLTAAVSTARP